MSSAAGVEAIFYPPHPDDLELSMVFRYMWYQICGYNMVVVNMSKGGVDAASIRLGDNETVPCVSHGYVHDPALEGYTVPTKEQIGDIRLTEATASIGAMTTLPMRPGITRGTITHEFAGLPDQWGNGGSSGAPTEAGIQSAYDVMQTYIDRFPGSVHFTMSHTDRHPDHRACGEALRRHRLNNPTLGGSGFHVSRLYWDYTQYPDVGVQPGLNWYGSGNADVINWRDQNQAVLKSRLLEVWSAWQPNVNVFGVGYHQVINQFMKNLGPSATISNLIHS